MAELGEEVLLAREGDCRPVVASALVVPACVKRRELLARQHRALYGNESPAFFPPGAFSDDNPRPGYHRRLGYLGAGYHRRRHRAGRRLGFRCRTGRGAGGRGVRLASMYPSACVIYLVWLLRFSLNTGF
jgi:hypothetical protein